MRNETTLLSSEERGQRLKRLRDMVNLSRKTLSDLSGYGASTIQFWENGTGRGLYLKEAIKFIEVFQKLGIECSIDWLYYGEGTEPIQLSTTAKKKLDNAGGDSLLEEIKFFNHLYSDATTLIIEDDTMQPFYNPDDWVGGIKQYGELVGTLVNQRCIIELEDGTKLCRVLKFSEKIKRYHLRGINPLSDSTLFNIENVKIISAAKVIWHREPLF